MRAMRARYGLLLRRYTDLAAILLSLVGLVLIVALSPSSVLARSVLAVPVLVVFPGYLVTTIIWPSMDPGARNGMGWTERAGYSAGLSILVMLAILLLLNWAWEIALDSVMIALSSFILASMMASLVLRQRCGGDGLSYVELWEMSPSGPDMRVVIAIGCAMVVVAVSTIGYIATYQPAEDSYSELYILDSRGGTDGLPTELSSGEVAVIRVCVRCMEAGDTEYTLCVRLVNSSTDTGAPTYQPTSVDAWDGVYSMNNTFNMALDIEVAMGGTWEEDLSFEIIEAGEYRLDLLLSFKGGDEIKYKNNLWITVA